MNKWFGLEEVVCPVSIEKKNLGTSFKSPRTEEEIEEVHHFEQKQT